MKVTTQYGVGDVVWKIIPGGRERQERPCPLCAATGEVAIAGSDRWTECPDCFFGLIAEWVDINSAAKPLTIGLVEVRTECKTDRGAKQVRYMCKETGIGSGTVHKEEDFYATREEAAAVIAAEMEGNE